jgi:hypothetical protein
MGPRYLQTLALSAGLLLTGSAFAQNDTPHPWRSADGDYGQPTQPDIAPDPAQQPNQAPAPPQQLPNPYTPLPSNNQQGANYGNYNDAVPAHLTIRPGTYVIVRTAEFLSSDHSAPGQTFIATLAEPVIVDGVVVAQRGQTVYGRVTEAQRAGRVEGVSRLGIELTGLTAADGQQLPIQSQMISHVGPTSNGRDAAAIAGTTGLGAAIGAAVGWGTGAAIGAGAGAVAGLAGVLLTRGEPTVIPPESMLTFRVLAPVEIATDRAPQAFHNVGNQDYAQNNAPPQQGYARRPMAPAPGYPAPGYAAAPPPAYYGPSYYPYPYYGAPGFSVVIGPRYGYYGGYRGGYYRGYRRW